MAIYSPRSLRFGSLPVVLICECASCLDLEMRVILCAIVLLSRLALHYAESHTTNTDSVEKLAVVEKNDSQEGETMLETLSSFVEKMSSDDSSMSSQEEAAVEKEVIAMLDRAENSTSLQVLPGVATIDKVDNRGARFFGSTTGGSLGEKVETFLQTHALRLKLPGFGNAEEGRGRLKRLLLPFLILLKLLLSTVVFPTFASGIALIALKGLWHGLAGGLVAGAVGLSELVAKAGWAPHPPRVTVLRPHVPIEHVYHGAHGLHPAEYLHHGWSRTGAAPAAAAAGAGPALDPYRGYGPSSPVGASWDARPVLH